jgi:transcriptional regulator with XRE-family HTH domain
MILFQKNISLLRTKKSMTLSQITKELGFSASQWSNYEQGVSFPKFLDLIKIANYFEISETDLIHTELAISYESKIKNDESVTKNPLSQDIIELQNKLILVQEEKIKDLIKEIKQLKH